MDNDKSKIGAWVGAALASVIGVLILVILALIATLIIKS